MNFLSFIFLIVCKLLIFGILQGAYGVSPKKGVSRNKNFKLLSGFFSILSFLGRLYLMV